jgi:hypothetical protein
MTKATRPVVRGNPDIDKLTLDELRLLEMKIMDNKYRVATDASTRLAHA